MFPHRWLQLLLIGCLLLQLAAPAIACQHAESFGTGHACHDVHGQPASDDGLHFCAKCFACGQIWTAQSGLLPHHFARVGSDWCPNVSACLSDHLIDRLFKPPRTA